MSLFPRLTGLLKISCAKLNACVRNKLIIAKKIEGLRTNSIQTMKKKPLDKIEFLVVI